MTDQDTSLDQPITPPSRPMRPSDYGTPTTNWPALIASLVVTAVAVGAAIAVVL